MANPEPEVEQGAEDVQPLDPFSRHRRFAGEVRGGALRSSVQGFLDRRPEPLDITADKVLNLEAFGAAPHAFVRAPRVRRQDEYPEGLDDQLKECERQFILRNLDRYVKPINKDDPLEFEHVTIHLADDDLDARAHLAELHRRAELLDALGVDHVRAELAWRHEMQVEMQWERYFCKEIRDDFKGPIWKHHPDTNPVPRDVSRSLVRPESESVSDGEHSLDGE